MNTESFPSGIYPVEPWSTIVQGPYLVSIWSVWWVSWVVLGLWTSHPFSWTSCRASNCVSHMAGNIINYLELCSWTQAKMVQKMLLGMNDITKKDEQVNWWQYKEIVVTLFGNYVPTSFVNAILIWENFLNLWCIWPNLASLEIWFDGVFLAIC